MSAKTRRLANVGMALLVVAMAGCPAVVLGPVLSVSQVAFNFKSDVSIDAFTISNNGSGTLNWFIVEDDLPPWLDVAPLEGSIENGNQVVTMELNDAASALEPGVQQDEFTVFSNGGNQLVSVSLRVTAAGDLIVDPLTLDFGTLAEQSSFTVRNGGTELLEWEIDSITPSDQWLSISPDSPTQGSITTQVDTVLVDVDREGLEPGTYEGEIVVTSNGGEAVVSVTMVVPAATGLVSVSPVELDFETEQPVEDSIAIRNVGTGVITWTITDNLPGWLSVDSLSGTVEDEVDRVIVSVDPTDLDPGEYMHTILISATDLSGEEAGSRTVDVTLTVPEPMPQLDVTPTLFDLGELDDADFFKIQNSGTGTLEWELSVNVPWINIDPEDPASGSLTLDNEIIDFSVDRSVLTAGEDQEGTISVTSNGGNAEVTVIIDVLPPTLEVVPQTLNFSTNFTEKLIAVFNRGTGTVNWTIDTSSFPSWLRDEEGNPLISQTSGSVSGEETDSVVVGVNRRGEEPGDFAFDAPGIVVDSDAGQIPVAVFMEVSQNPVLSVDTGVNEDGVPNVDLENVPFVPVGFAETATFSIVNVGTGPVTWQIDSSGFPSWLTLSDLGPQSLAPGDGPFEVEVTIDRTGLSFGPFSHTLTIESSDRDNSTQPVRIEMSVPKSVVINATPDKIDLGNTGTTDVMLVANFGDPDTVLNFGVQSNKEWLFAFPTEGRSIGVVNPQINGDFQPINISIDRTGLDGAGGGTGTLTVFAQRLAPDEDDEDGDGDVEELILQRDDSIAPPVQVEVSVQAAELFFETPPARLRVPSQVRYVTLMRNLRFEPVPIADPLLEEFEDNFFIFENDTPLELTESNQFLTSANNLRNDVLILLDYSGSAFTSAALAQEFHTAVQMQLAEDFPDEMFPDFPGFEDADDPLQFIYETCISSLLQELPESYNVSIAEFHDRDQGMRQVIDFTRNDAAGQQLLLDALDAINVTNHGATELIPALFDASDTLVEENSPLPSTGPVIPAVPFDDADVRTILMISDGRLTTGPGSINDAVQILRNNRTRLLAVAWGDKFNAGPMATIASETGGHVYITRRLNSGVEDGSGNPIRVPGLDPLFDWCNTDLMADPCDLSISQDLQSQVVLSYVTLNVDDAVQGRVSASFDSPNDGDEEIACRLTDQGDIAGEFTQELPVGEVVGGDDAGLGVNLGQISMDTAGIQTGQADVFIVSDYMPRDIVELEFVFAAETPGVAQGSFDIDDVLMSVTGVPLLEEGIFQSSWTIEDLGGGVDPDTGLNTATFRLDTGGTPIQFGAFGRILRVNLDVPGLTPYNFRLLEVTPTTRNGDFRAFTHPDGIPVRNTRFRAPSFPTPRVNPTILDFGDTSTTQSFTVNNVGGTYTPADVQLFWSIVGGQFPNVDLEVVPSEGILASTTEEFEVTVTLDRTKPDTGPITDLSMLFEYETGIDGVAGLFPILIQGTILDPELTITSGDFEPGTMTIDLGSGPQGTTTTEEFTVSNTGQSTMLWFRTGALPAWLSVTDSIPVTSELPQSVFVTVNRAELDPGDSVSEDIQITATTFDGKIVGTETVTVTAQVDP